MGEPLKILMISDVYFPRINGVSTSIATFKRELEALGHRVTLIAPAYPAGETDDEHDIIRIPSRYLFLDPEDRMMKRGAIRRLLPQLRATGYDLLHIQTPFIAHYQGLWLARKLGIPRIESYHTYFQEYLFHYFPLLPDGVMRAIARSFSRSQCNAMDAIVVPSVAMSEVLGRYGVKTHREIVPTGIELEDFNHGDGAAFRTKLGISAETPVLVHVGRIAFEKNIDFLLRVMVRVRQALPQAQMVIAGEGPALSHVKHLARKLGIAEAVHFVGYLDRRKALLDCYRAGDAFLFASRTETQGLVLLESMALGVPVVSTAVMGTRDIVEPELGTVLCPEDEAGFADRTVALLTDAERRRNLGVQARHFAEGWSAPSMAENMQALYQRVLDETSQTGSALTSDSRSI